MSISDWAPGEGPRDKLLERGPLALSDAELLAVVLQTGYRDCSAVELARELLERGGVAVTPGRDFGSNRPKEHLRFAYTTEIARLEEGVDRIRRFIADSG